MIRAFAALALPETLRFELMLIGQGLPVPRPVPPENLHLTLAFLGEIPEPLLEEVDLAFRQLRAPGFDLTLSGLGLFGGRKPRIAYIGAADSPGLRHLQSKVETAARSVGVALPAHRFVPHVTLARLPERHAANGRLEAEVAARTATRLPGFPVEDFRLYRSRLAASGARYEELACYPLVAAPVG